MNITHSLSLNKLMKNNNFLKMCIIKTSSMFFFLFGQEFIPLLSNWFIGALNLGFFPSQIF